MKEIPPIAPAFIEAFRHEYGSDECDLLLQCLEREDPAPSIRRHPVKGIDLTVAGHEVPWCPTLGYYLDLEDRPTFGIDPLWHAGAYYVQEAASMVIAQYIKEHEGVPEVAIDLCAAPGGKSTLLRSLLPSDTLLIANEPDRARSQILRENILRHGSDEVIVTQTLPHKLREAGVQCDLILVDAPCSGEGMFRKDPASRLEWSTGAVTACAERQREIIQEAWSMLREGGLFIYSTCTYNSSENEAQLEYLLSLAPQATLIELPQLTALKATTPRHRGVYHFMPHRTQGEGLTIWAVRKGKGRGAIGATAKRNKPVSLPEPLVQAGIAASHVIQQGGLYHYLSPLGQTILVQLQQNKIAVLSAGVALGELKGKDFVPAHAWAMSTLIYTHCPYSKSSVTLSDALQYIRRDTLTLKGEDLAKGIHLLLYQGVPLGWGKHLGNRTNNLYPKELVMHNRTATVSDIIEVLSK